MTFEMQMRPGTQTIQRLSKIVADKDSRQVGKATCTDRGETVILATGVNAIDNITPPFFTFPRVFSKEHFIQARPPDCIGTVHPLGCMTFFIFVKCFHRYTESSKKHPCHLLINNHKLRGR